MDLRGSKCTRCFCVAAVSVDEREGRARRYRVGGRVALVGRGASIGELGARVDRFRATATETGRGG